MSVVYDYNDFPINNLHFSDPLKTSGGSYIGKSYIKKSHSKKETDFYIQLPKLVCSNISLNHPDSRNYIEFELHAKNLELYDFISALDDRNITMAFRNSDTWFQQSLSMDTIDDFYRSIIKPKRGMKPPSFKIRVPTQKGNIMVPTYNEKKQLVDLKNVNPQDELSVIVQIVGLRFMKQQFICELNLIQAKHYPMSNMPQDYLFLDGNKKDTLSPIDMIDLDTLSINEEITHPTVYLDQNDDEKDQELVDTDLNNSSNIKEENLLTQEKEDLTTTQEEIVETGDKDKENPDTEVDGPEQTTGVVLEQVEEIKDKEDINLEQVIDKEEIVEQQPVGESDENNYENEKEIELSKDNEETEIIKEEANNTIEISENNNREEITKEEDILGVDQENLLDTIINDHVNLRLDQEKKDDQIENINLEIDQKENNLETGLTESNQIENNLENDQKENNLETDQKENNLENDQKENDLETDQKENINLDEDQIDSNNLDSDQTEDFENNLLDSLNITEERETNFPKKETEIITIKEDYEKDIEMVEEEILNLQKQMEKLQLEQSKKKEKLRKLQSDQVETEFEYEL